jgi:hypothetical protein
MRRQLAGLAPSQAMNEQLNAMRKTKTTRQLSDFVRNR